MSRRSILSTAERVSLLALPDTEEELIRHYIFSELDLSLIRQRPRGREPPGCRCAVVFSALSRSWFAA